VHVDAEERSDASAAVMIGGALDEEEEEEEEEMDKEWEELTVFGRAGRPTM
jgi:hypothetical protein